jgi:hypothetical protein
MVLAFKHDREPDVRCPAAKFAFAQTSALRSRALNRSITMTVTTRGNLPVAGISADASA